MKPREGRKWRDSGDFRLFFFFFLKEKCQTFTASRFLMKQISQKWKFSHDLPTTVPDGKFSEVFPHHKTFLELCSKTVLQHSAEQPKGLYLHSFHAAFTALLWSIMKIIFSCSFSGLGTEPRESQVPSEVSEPNIWRCPLYLCWSVTSDLLTVHILSWKICQTVFNVEELTLI